MRKNIIILLCLFFISNFTEAQVPKCDTFFIRKDSIDGFVNSIFIDRNPNESHYNGITNFEFSRFNFKAYEYSLKYLEDKKHKITKQNFNIKVKKWIEIKYFKGDYFAYRPCDFYFFFAHSINDSTFIDWIGEGSFASKIIDFKKINSLKYSFKLDGIYNEDRQLYIYILDIEKNIALFESMQKGGKAEYYLMIDADKIKTLPMIINWCTEKRPEYDSEIKNYKKLIGK